MSSTLEQIAAKYEGERSVTPDGRVLDCWRFPTGWYARRWAEEAKALGVDVWQSLDMGGSMGESA